MTNSSPVLTANSPTSGSISWSSFTITYKGNSYTISAGSSSSLFNYWTLASPTSVQTTNSLPNLGPDDSFLFLNRNGTPTLILDKDIIDGALIAPNTIQGNTIAAGTITPDKLTPGGITGSQIAPLTITNGLMAPNSVSNTNIANGSINPEKLTAFGQVSDNAIMNGDFEILDATGTFFYGWSNVANAGRDTNTANVISGSAILTLAATTSTTAQVTQTSNAYIPMILTFTGETQWYFSCVVRSLTQITSGFTFAINWYDSNKNLLSTTNIVNNAGVPNLFFTMGDVAVTPPSNARWASVTLKVVNPNVNTTVFVDNVVAYRIITTNRIADGSITASKLASLSVPFSNLTTGRLGAGQLLTAGTTGNGFSRVEVDSNGFRFISRNSGGVDNTLVNFSNIDQGVHFGGTLSVGTLTASGTISGQAVNAVGSLVGDLGIFNTDIQVAGATLPRGLIGIRRVSANSVFTAGELWGAGLAITIFPLPGRVYKYTIQLKIGNNSADGSGVLLKLRDSGVTGTIYGEARLSGADIALTSNGGTDVTFTWYLDSLPGPVALAPSIQSNSGAAFQFLGSVSNPSISWVEDLGN